MIQIAASRHQRFPQRYMKLGCALRTHMARQKQALTFDASTCVVIYTDAAPAAVDLAAAIGTNTALPGTASAPAQGTYGFPYIKLGTDFTVAGSFTNTPAGGVATTYYSRGSNGTVDTTGASSCANRLVKKLCTRWYAHLVIWAQLLLAELWTASSLIHLLQEVNSGEATGGNCNKSDRLVAVMNLSTPFTVTSQTYAVNFNFVLTNYGAQFIDGSDLTRFRMSLAVHPLLVTLLC